MSLWRNWVWFESQGCGAPEAEELRALICTQTVIREQFVFKEGVPCWELLESCLSLRPKPVLMD